MRLSVTFSFPWDFRSITQLKPEIMAGGKETPRQKMIGMMYLVLTALLALNVSQTILDAFVAIEENIQISNENEHARGLEKRNQLQEQAENASEQALRKLAVQQFAAVEKIDDMTAKVIRQIDEIKLKLLENCGEDLTVGPGHIITRAFDLKEPLKPTRMNLEKVESKDEYDKPMYLLIGEDIKRPDAKGMEIWKSYNQYRNQLVSILASTAISEDKKYFFNAPTIRQYKNYADLNQQLDKAMQRSVVHPDDREIIVKIYAALSKNERYTVNDVTGVHWIGKTFDQAPSVAALASLSSLQKEILTARADAIAHLRNRIGGSEYSFNKIMPLAYGPELVNSGDEVSLQVLMAAFDSYTDPSITVDGGQLTEVKNGIGKVVFKPTATGDYNLKGNISIRNKRGETKTMSWNKTVRVMKPSGTVSLPEMNRLYRGYPNIVEGVASGYEETILTGSGVDLKKSGKQWIASPGNGRTCTVTISGRSSASQKTVTLGTYTFKVSTLPAPNLYWGNVPEGDKLGVPANQIFSKYGPEIPLNVDYNIISYTITAQPFKRPINVSGARMSTADEAMMRQLRKGDVIQITAMVRPKNGGGPASKVVGSWTKD
jgi:gliding motility-associated protein GldM